MTDRLRSIWGQVIGRSPSEINDTSNFFELGGDSVAAIRLVALAQESGIRLDATAVYAHPTLEDMSQAKSESIATEEVETQAKEKSASELIATWALINSCLSQCSIGPESVEDIFPCTPMQEEFLPIVQPWTLALERGSVDQVKEAIACVLSKTPILRARIFEHEQNLYQVIVKDRIHWHEEFSSIDEYISSNVRQRMQRGQPLTRLAIIHDHGMVYVACSWSHCVSDRVSKIHLFNDLGHALADQKAFSALPKRPSYRAIAEYCTSSSKRKAGIDFWRNHLSGLRKPDIFYALDKKNDYRKLTPFVRQLPFTRSPVKSIMFSTVTHVAWALTIADMFKEDDIFFNYARTGRQIPLAGLDKISGCLACITPFRIFLETEQTLMSLLEQVQNHIIAGFEHEPFGVLASREHFGDVDFRQNLFVHDASDFKTQISWKGPNDVGQDSSLRFFKGKRLYARLGYGTFLNMLQVGTSMLVIGSCDEYCFPPEQMEKLVDNFIEMATSILEDGATWNKTDLSHYCSHLHSAKFKYLTNAGRSLPNFPVRTLAELWVTTEPSSAVIIPSEPAVNISFNQLRLHVNDFYRALGFFGVDVGHVVAMALPNSYEFIVSFLAIISQRAIAAPLNHNYKEQEFDFYFEDMSPKVLLLPAGAMTQRGAAVTSGQKRGVIIAECSFAMGVVNLDVKDWGYSHKSPYMALNWPLEEDVALILHTSGTTGLPKAVPLTHKNLLTSTRNLCKTYALTSSDRTMLVMPLFHIHGLVASFFSPFLVHSGVILPQRLLPDFWTTFTNHGGTWYSATPTMHDLISRFDDKALQTAHPKKLRFIRSCSSALSPALLHRLEEKFGSPVLESYAMTEASHIMTSNPLPPAARVPGSVGIVQGIELQVLGDDGIVVPNGEVGEVCIKGTTVTTGYRNNEAANTSSFTADGFFRTGDQGKVDGNGYLTLTGRLKEFINKGGEKISPVELDNVISQHAAVDEVVCFAIDDDMYGQEVGCAVRLKKGRVVGAEDLRKWARQRIAAHKVPKQIWLLHEIPKTATGKLQRKMVAEVVQRSNKGQVR